MIPRRLLAGFFILFLVLPNVGAWAMAAHANKPNTWTTVAPLPQSRFWPAAAGAGGRIYVFGGLCRTGFCNTFESYNPRTNTWTAMGALPEALAGIPSATYTDGRIYLAGSAAPTPNRRGGPALLVYDPATNRWAQTAPSPGFGGTAQLLTGLGGVLYAIGGRHDGSIADTLDAYNPSTRKWTFSTAIPHPRYYPGATLGPDGRIYIIGGAERNGKSDRVEAFNARTGKWSTVASLPTPRSALQAVTGPDGRIYAIGGRGKCFTTPCRVVEAYDVRSNGWTAVAPLPHHHAAFAAVVGLDGRIYVLGGNPTVVDVYTTVPAGQPLPVSKPGPTPIAKTLAPMPTARDSLAAAAGGDGLIYAIGGESTGPVKPGGIPAFLNSVEAYNPKSNAWRREPSLPGARLGLAATTGPDGRIYVVGGSGDGKGRLLEVLG
ncbi:MAG TPA: kelch repeat-containing protein [Chloroflexota bacterium]